MRKYIKLYFWLLTSKALWTCWGLWVVFGIGVLSVFSVEPENRVNQSIRCGIGFVIFIMVIVLVGMIEGILEHKESKHKDESH